MKLNLGIIKDSDGNIINHRSLVKVLFNPIFRRFGFYIGTLVKDNKIIEIKFCKGQKTNTIYYDFETCPSGVRIAKRQIL